MLKPTAIAAGLLLVISACGGGAESSEDTAALTSAPAATEVAVETTDAPEEETTTTGGRTGVEKLCAKYHKLVDDDGDGWGRCERSEVPTTSSTVYVPPLPPYTIEEIQAALAPVAQAWTLAPSPTTYDNMSLVAQSIIDSGRKLPDVGLLPMEDQLSPLLVYPGNDAEVLSQLLYTLLVPLNMQFDGTFTVGVDIQPGTYKTFGYVNGCYWETLDAAGEINDNNFVDSAPQVIMTVRSRDFAVHMEDCGPWVKIG